MIRKAQRNKLWTPATEAEAIRLRNAGMSFSEIAKALGRGAGAVEDKLRRMRRAGAPVAKHRTATEDARNNGALDAIAARWGGRLTTLQIAAEIGIHVSVLWRLVRTARDDGDERFPRNGHAGGISALARRGSEWRRRLLRMIVVEKMPFTQIGQKLGIAPETARMIATKWREDGTITPDEWDARHAKMYRGNRKPVAAGSGTPGASIPLPSGSELRAQVEALIATKGITVCPAGYAERVSWMGAPAHSKGLVPPLSLRDPVAFEKQKLYGRKTYADPAASRKKATKASAVVSRKRRKHHNKADAALKGLVP